MTARTLTAAVNTELGKSTTAPRWLVKIEFDSGDVRLWNGIGDLTAFAEVYTGTGRLGRIEPIRETQDIVASGVQMSLLIMPTADQPDAIDAILNIALAETYQGRPVTIWQAQINPDVITFPPPFTPAQLFAAGEAGAYYDPSDPSTVWQDSARTTPAVADDPVGAIDDLSGNGNHALQADPAGRPILRQSGGLWYLEFDRIDDRLVTAAAIGLNAAPIQLSAAFAMDDSAPGQTMIDNARYLSLRNGSGGSKAVFTTATVKDYESVEAVFTDANALVLHDIFDSAFDVTWRKNGTNLTKVAGSADGNLAEAPMNIGARASGVQQFGGKLYALIALNTNMNGDDLINADAWLADKAGVDMGVRRLIADPFIRFKGFLDVMEDSELPGAAIIKISAENRLIDLERPRRRTYTPEDQKASHPGDTFFDEVAALQNREIKL